MTPSIEQPIGIFDSGVGGLTVARAVLDQLPHEPLMYVGDTARGPYGPLPIAEVRQYALELAKYNILVNAISPGPVVTNIGGGRLKQADARRPFERAAPLGRIAQPSDLQGAALFLASPASSLITGTEIVIDGGRVLGTAD